MHRLAVLLGGITAMQEEELQEAEVLPVIAACLERVRVNNSRLLL